MKRQETVDLILLELSHVQVFFDVVRKKIKMTEDKRRELIDVMEPAIMQFVKDAYGALSFIQDHNLMEAFKDFMSDIDLDLYQSVVEEKEEIVNES